MHGLSFIIPAYNRAELIDRCLDSILATNCRPLEVIVVDDGSTDATVQRVRTRKADFADLEISLQVIELEHGGAQIARNHGLANASMKRVIFLDSDDYLDAAGLDQFVAAIDDYDFELAVGIVENVDQDGKLIERFGTKWQPENTNQILNYDWHTCGVIYEREYVERIGGWATELCGSQDWEIQVRAKSNATKVTFHNIRVGFWVAHSGNRVGATSFKRLYTESVLIACGLNLTTLVAKDQATIVNQLRLAARVSIHLAELRENGVSDSATWSRVKVHFPKMPFWFSLGLKLPWSLIAKFRRGNT